MLRNDRVACALSLRRSDQPLCSGDLEHMIDELFDQFDEFDGVPEARIPIERRFIAPAGMDTEERRESRAER